MVTLTSREVGEVGLGVVSGSVVHQFVESFLDKYFVTGHPEDYQTYSSGTTIIIMTLLGIVLYVLYNRGTIGSVFGGMGAGIVLGEIPQLIDMVRVKMSLGIEG